MTMTRANQSQGTTSATATTTARSSYQRGCKNDTTTSATPARPIARGVNKTIIQQTPVATGWTERVVNAPMTGFAMLAQQTNADHDLCNPPWGAVGEQSMEQSLVFQPEEITSGGAWGTSMETQLGPHPGCKAGHRVGSIRND